MRNLDIIQNFEQLNLLYNQNNYINPIIDYAIAINLTTMAPKVSIINGIQEKILNHYKDWQQSTNEKTIIATQNLTFVEKEINSLHNIDTPIDLFYVSLSNIYDDIISLNQIQNIFFMIDDDLMKQRRKRIMKLTNTQIYNYANNLFEAFNDGDQKLPIKISFYLQKNKNTLLQLAQDIETSRIEIAKTYGTLDEETNQYIIPPEKMEDANKELNDLFSLEQDVQIYTINIDNLSDDITITTAQMEAIMFMIEQ